MNFNPNTYLSHDFAMELCCEQKEKLSSVLNYGGEEPEKEV